jgi:hypothetical protein
MLTSLKQLLTSIVDYAGLFPPAQLSLLEAMTQYDRAKSSPYQWMLDRFVLPASRLQELVTLLPKFCEGDEFNPWSLSVILSKNWEAELEQLQEIHKTSHTIVITALEVAPLPPDEIEQVCSNLPPEVFSFFEIPFDVDLQPYVKVLQQTGAAAKLRTGGITSNAFPDGAQLSQRILTLTEAQIPFKATAGLHHPLRGNYRLTYQPDSATATMHGFLNLVLLTAFAYQSITDDEALVLLAETTIAPFQFTDTTIRWHDYSLSLSDIAHCRQSFRSFGSCSFQEPIDDLCNLGLL